MSIIFLVLNVVLAVAWSALFYVNQKVVKLDAKWPIFVLAVGAALESIKYASDLI